MPRPKKPGAGEPKRRSRNGCWPCKQRKVKCGEEKPRCLNCDRQGETCDYSIRLNWGGRTKRSLDDNAPASGTSSATNSPHTMTLSFDNIIASPSSPSRSSGPKSKLARHARSQSATLVSSDASMIDPELVRMSNSHSQPINTLDTLTEHGFHVEDTRRQPMSAPFTIQQSRGGFDYPSPNESSFDSSSFSTANYPCTNVESPPSMPPPLQRNSLYATSFSRQHTEPADVSHRHQRRYSVESPATPDACSPQTGPPTPYSSFIPMPLTPNSSVSSDDPVLRTTSKQPSTQYLPTDLRRLSVQSLLDPPNHGSESNRGRQYPIGDTEYTTYGYDIGLPDLDTPRNDDANAIAVFSPPSGAMELDGHTPYGNTEVRGKDMAFESGGYYAKPVPIKISKSLEPLPPLLLENPMNLLYFHHFLNHTARILVPHDCERNPFREILPEMAVKNDNILNLLLAYSASHRARMLNHAEPVNRVALWVRDVFPKLRQSLATATHPGAITNSTLAPAIMMASLEIISPNTFEVPISWQNHLTMARQMIIARGGPRSMDRSDHAAYFLSRWFAYLDVLGSLSGNKNDQPLGSFYWSSENATADEDFQIDCLTGFTNRCVGSLARIAELAKRVEAFRIGCDGNINEDFRPSHDIIAQATAIEKDLFEAFNAPDKPYKGCNHRSSASSESEGAWDATEIYATNEMFHWAGLIHLYRRVLNRPPTHSSVQEAVRQIMGLLYKVRRGSTAEACLLFPMFAAGCDAQEEGQREKVMERLRCVEGIGMVQVQKARGLMQRVWDTGKPWESLVEGEFFG
ncbi:hypothetical protein P280DRAFT_505155 [Massarina eburnea CBS 473.64]|uniref:Zn(2)-C6 fungal-type domain-containing protein n=1 Tax=Massarina eburnea CBS 473.64 TaxID=1395130 RepID=A0A6A6SAT8_9PLEO|nr:hypothetical protein P280DRAFT_505155 [Massarina eburnea CBS 473.64]